MFKTENILLILLIAVCFLVSMVVIDSLIDPGEILRAVLGQGQIEIYQPELEDDLVQTEDGGEPVLDSSTEGLPEGWKLYRNEGYAFEIGYPDSVVDKSIPEQAALNAGLGRPADSPVWEFKLTDPDFYQNTNLVSASVVVQVTRGQNTLAECTQYKNGSQYQRTKAPLPEVVLNQNSYVKDIADEGVMGGEYLKTSYRVVYQDACYEITQVVQTNNIENYAPGTIERYDQDLVNQILDQVLSTFTLLDVSATFPEVKYPEIKMPDRSAGIEAKSGGYADGIDVSHWQGDIGWLKVADAGISFAFVKATEGINYTDFMLQNNMAEGSNAGVYLGVYHFARPDLGNTGKEEAEYFLSVAGDYLKSGYLRPVLDLEKGGSLGAAALSSWVLEWAQTVENQTGIAPLIYTNLYYINNYLTDAVTDYDLWMAYWNCDPTVTGTIPPTGRWNDWAFWQYCVADSHTIPGIKTTIDLDIYNGIETSLSQYDAASRLWVSVIADAKQAPVPYFADLTVDVNGDETGPINYYLWWDCDSLDTDTGIVTGACGELPEPAVGECLADEMGMVCLGVDADQMIAEHTYTEIAYYTPKVIVERGEGSPVEDRYQLYAYNPIRLISPLPASPGSGEYQQDFSLEVSVTTTTSLPGVLQVEVVEDDSGQLLDSSCVSLSADATETNAFPYSLPWSTEGTKTYSLVARYRRESSCAVQDTDEDDVTEGYEIEWPLIREDEIGLYNPEGGSWALKSEFNYLWEDVNWFIFGPVGESWISISGDWNGDGVDTVGLYNPGNKNFYLKQVNGPGWDDVIQFVFDPSPEGGIPIAGDWDGDGLDTIGIYDPALSEWYLSSANASEGDLISFAFGPGGDGRLPVVGDWDGDGIDTVGLYFPDNSSFSLKSEHTSGWNDVSWFIFGLADSGREPIAGDWDGSGSDTIGLYDPLSGRWFLKFENAPGWTDVLIFKFGPGGNRIPLTGKWQ